MRKKVDERIRTLIENGVKSRHRSLFVMVGDKFQDQIVNLHHILSSAQVKTKPTVLWCYKNKLAISSKKEKALKETKRLVRYKLLDPEKADRFLLFITSVGISFRKYRDSEQILGNTFSMCVLQDFEALTPNLLARTIETVEGGGVILLLLKSLASLTSLYTMVMDAHERFRTSSHSEVTPRFNERFLLSLASCKSCAVIDDELNILPISSHIKSITSLPVNEDLDGLSQTEKDLKNLKEQFNEDFPVGPLIKKCCTLDQGNAVVTFLDSILDKNLCTTVALLAARGRGKSAALGLAVAGAVAAGFSNIFITAPGPENLKTLFEFVLKGLESLGYKELSDYDVMKSSGNDSKNITHRINIFKDHRQTIQYIHPHEHEKLSQVELLVIDEAAALPLPVVKSLLGPYLVFISSTVNGYEGTGRSLSLKLLDQLKRQSQMPTKSSEGRLFKEVKLNESIRYAPGDPIEFWLNRLLCLDAADFIPDLRRLYSLDQCDLYYVNRDTLFSGHKESELFLQRMMALYVASHYKNSPDDLQLLADAPAHHLFVLLGSVDESKNHLPDILCVIQVCLEGEISRESARQSLNSGKGYMPHGDQIPWKFCTEFGDEKFLDLSGARVVRIATHPGAMRCGYGSKAVELLTRYYQGELASITEDDLEVDADEALTKSTEDNGEKASLLEEEIKPRKQPSHLLVHAGKRRPERVDYLGVSYGLTHDLFRFWDKQGFLPFYIARNPNAVTGEHCCMMLRPLKDEDYEICRYPKFREKFVQWLGFRSCTMGFKLAMSILEPKSISKINFSDYQSEALRLHMVLDFVQNTVGDMAMLKAYADDRADFPQILYLLKRLAEFYFLKLIPVSLSATQASILLCMGLQVRDDISYITEQMNLEGGQIRSELRKAVRKIHKYFYDVACKEIDSTLPHSRQFVLQPHSVSVDEDLTQAAKQVEDQMRAKAAKHDASEDENEVEEEDDRLNENAKEVSTSPGDGLLNPEVLKKYAIVDRDADFENALMKSGGRIPSSGVMSVKSDKKKKHGKDDGEKKRSKSGGSASKSHKKRKTKT